LKIRAAVTPPAFPLPSQGESRPKVVPFFCVSSGEGFVPGFCLHDFSPPFSSPVLGGRILEPKRNRQFFPSPHLPDLILLFPPGGLFPLLTLSPPPVPLVTTTYSGIHPLPGFLASKRARVWSRFSVLDATPLFVPPRLHNTQSLGFGSSPVRMAF